MPRLNISVPDDLYKRLDEVRDSLNVSAVCQEALRREISRREPMPSDVDVTEETIERLRSEKEDHERRSRDRGFQVGMEWARRAKYNELHQWGEYEPGRAERLADLNTPPYETVQWLYELSENTGGTKVIDGFLKSYPELKYAEVVWDYPNDPYECFWFHFGDKRFFNEGFLDAVKQFWHIVKERI